MIRMWCFSYESGDIILRLQNKPPTVFVFILENGEGVSMSEESLNVLAGWLAGWLAE